MGRLNRALAMETYLLMKELDEFLQEEDQTLAQMSGMLDRTPAREVDNDFLNTLSLRMKERKHLLTRQRSRTAQMQATLHRRLEEEGLMKVKLKATRAAKPRPVTKDPIITQASQGSQVQVPKEMSSPLEQLGPPTCKVCEKDLVKGERFARCNHDNLFFHAPCLAPYYDCPECKDNLADFMGIFAR